MNGVPVYHLGPTSVCHSGENHWQELEEATQSRYTHHPGQRTIEYMQAVQLPVSSQGMMAPMVGGPHHLR